MHDDDTELTVREQALFAALPRESHVPAGEEQRTVRLLRQEGFLRARSRLPRVALQLAAGLTLFAAGAFAGSQHGQRYSIETMLDRTDLTLDDRVYLLQRAGSAYVRAANEYASATSVVDSTAVEVASKVLMGAAHAVARQSLDGGFTVRLATMFSSPELTP
jgi:hypothetical protein